MEFLITLEQTLFKLSIFIAFSIAGLYLFCKWKKVVDFIAAENPSIKGQVVVIILAGVLIIAASEYAIVIAEARVNARDSIAIFSGILAGPIAGILVGVIGGVYRIGLGGWSAFPCGLGTIIAGIIGAYLSKYKGYKIKDITLRQTGIVAIITGLWETIDLEVLVPLLGSKPVMEGFLIMTRDFLIPMTLINMLGITVFILVCKDSVTIKKQQNDINLKTKRIAEITKSLDRYKGITEKKR